MTAVGVSDSGFGGNITYYVTWHFEGFDATYWGTASLSRGANDAPGNEPRPRGATGRSLHLPRGTAGAG